MEATVALNRPHFVEHTLRTKIRAELTVFNELLKMPFTDRLTKRIDFWHKRFVEALKVKDRLEERIVLFEGELQDILQGVEKRSYLGNDEYVYGERDLFCRLSDQTEFRKGRSPVKHDSERLFVIDRHLIAEGALQWLKKHHIRVVPPTEISAKYKQLKLENRLPTLPTTLLKAERLEKMRLIVRERERQVLVEMAVKEEAKAAIIAETRSFVDASLGAIDSRIEERERLELARGEAVKERGEALKAELAIEETAWSDRTAELKARLESLDTRVDDIWKGVTESEKAAALLEERISSVEKAIEERKAKAEDNLWGQVAEIVGKAVASHATGLMIASVAGGGTVIGLKMYF